MAALWECGGGWDGGGRFSIVSLCSNRRRKVLLETTNEDLKVEIKLVVFEKKSWGYGLGFGKNAEKNEDDDKISQVEIFPNGDQDHNLSCIDTKIQVIFFT